ncbi:ATP-binding protein [Actinacidiphila oryziradicis]|uniref:sensor histidine kinase n=1 Tax=Actinacidiphila oryziradicis TaxID=2571141 RepID=UPI0023F0178F|nr:ATP-binding protein [Actinacidiphila oryziradicis]MCW2874409.1 ATPase [Actinacidiphila oryziradicis]
MVHAGSSPGGQRRASALVWLLPSVVTAAAAALTVLAVDAGARTAVMWCGVAATIAVAVIAAETARRGRALAAMRERLAEREAALQHQLGRQEAETVRLAEKLLPQVVARMQQGDFAYDALSRVSYENEEDLSADFKAAHGEVLRSVVEAVQAEEDLRESAQRAFVNIARRVQAIVHQQATDLRAMEDRHGRDAMVFGDLLKLDHGTALIGRLADSIAVLGGARPGRQWSRAVPLFSVLRGAMSRIVEYQRVDLHAVTEIAVTGPAVEPLIHALAELLDNATRYSPPQTRVHLTAVEVQSGIAIEIEDGGVSLSEEARSRAERMLQQAQAGIDLNDLGETPRLGLAVVGRLAQAYGFQVSLRSSAYGGVRAVLIVPQDLVTTAPATGRAHGIGASSGPRPEPLPTTAAPAPEAAPAAAPVRAARPVTGPRPVELDDDAPIVTERNSNGLPQRRRRTPTVPTARTADAPAAAGPVTASPASATDEQQPVQPGMWLADFMSGVNGETPTTAPVRQNSDESSDKGE